MHTINEFGEAEGIPKYLPTPEEIKKMTAEIRKTWVRDNYVIRDSKGIRSPIKEHKLHVSADAIARSRD